MNRRSAASPSRRTAIAAIAWLLCLLPAPRSHAAGPTPRGEEFQVNEVADAIQQSSAVAIDSRGGFVVAWQSEIAGSGDEIRARRFDAQGAALGGEFAVNTLTAGQQNLPAVAAGPDGDFVVVWQSLIASNFEIRARRFDARGVAQGDEFAVDEVTGETHGSPAVAMDRKGDFVIAWESSRRGSYEIRVRRFAADGRPRGEEVTVNTLTAGSQRAPCVAIDEAGAFVVAWRSNVAGTFDIRARRFAADGAPQGDEFAVNAMIAGDQLAPAIAMDARGGFVIVWENAWNDGFEIRARRFAADGTAPAEERAVSPAHAGEQFSPSVAMNGRGEFVVVWHAKVDGSYDIRARSFAANGAPQNEENAVHQSAAGTQKTAAVAMNARGDFVVTWHSDATGSWEIGARRYERGRKTLPGRRGSS